MKGFRKYRIGDCVGYYRCDTRAEAAEHRESELNKRIKSGYVINVESQPQTGFNLIPARETGRKILHSG